MKSVSTSIVVVLVFLITTSLILIFFQWLFKYSSQVEFEVEKKSIKKEDCLKIENIDTVNKKITIRNCGKNEFSNFVVYLDSKPFITFSEKLGPGEIAQIEYTKYIPIGEHDIQISSDYAESPKIIFYKRCDVYIYQYMIPYTIDKNNTYYCLNEDVYIDNQNAINFAKNIQNSTLDCLGHNIDGNGTSCGIYFASKTTIEGSDSKNNVIKNCAVTNFDEGIHLEAYYWPPQQKTNNILTNITAISNHIGIYLRNANYNNISNILLKNNSYGIHISSGDYNILDNITASLNSWGIWLCFSNNNNITNSHLFNNSNIGIAIGRNCGGNVFSNDNWVIDTSIHDNKYDYSFNAEYNKNSISYFKSTNFTIRTIEFEDNLAWFSYNNRTDDIWLKTNISWGGDLLRHSVKILRKLIDWNQTLMQWNDTSSNTTTARYNITGLIPNTNYNVYNNSILISGSPLDSGSNGKISFTIDLLASEQHEIKVEKA